MKIENLDSELELKKEQDLESEQSVAVAAQPAAEEPTELPEKRGLRSRTFQKKKGVLETKYYNTPIHFADTETGALIELTGRLREDSGENVFRSERNRFSVAFDRGSQSSLLFEISKDEYAVRASLKSQFGKHAGHSAPVLQQDEKQLSFADVLPGVDLTYTVHGNGVGGAVILKEAGSGQRFAFCLKAENLLVSWLESEKTLQFRTKEAQEPVFQIPAAYMVDADGAYSGLVDFEVVRKSENECELTLLPDTDWLAQNRRAYPVRLEYRLLCAEEAPGLEFRRNDLTADGKVEVGGSGVPFRMQLPEQREGEVMITPSVLFACA